MFVDKTIEFKSDMNLEDGAGFIVFVWSNARRQGDGTAIESRREGNKV